MKRSEQPGSLRISHRPRRVTEKNLQALEIAKRIQDVYGVVKAAHLIGMSPLYLKSTSSIHSHIHKLEEFGLLKRVGFHWLVSELGLRELREWAAPAKVKIKDTPERMAQSIAKDVRKTVSLYSPIESLLNPREYDEFSDNLIALIGAYCEDRSVKA